MKNIFEKLFVFLNTPRGLAAFVLLSSAGALGFAYISQYVFNLQPCVLCLYQRKPYIVAIVLSLIVFVTDKPRLKTLLLSVCALSFYIGAGIAGYHTGVEQSWWEGTKSCAGGNLPIGASMEELRAYLIHQPIVRCDIPAWKLFSISMTGYNLLLSFGLGCITAFFSVKGLRSWLLKK
jgi:disulfide bond formation protein DsbB